MVFDEIAAGGKVPLTVTDCRGHGSWRADRTVRGAAALALAYTLSGAAALAETAEFCVTCQGPDATYRCTFESESAMPGRPGLQLHCISTLAREGGHQSCAIGRASKAPCAGTLKVLALPGPAPGIVPSDPAHANSSASETAKVDGGSVTPDQTTVLEPPQADVEMLGARQAPAATAPAKPPATVKRTWNDTSGPAGQPAPAAKAPAAGPAQAVNAPDEAAAEPASNDLLKPLDSAGRAVSNAAKSTGEALGKAGDAVGSAAKKSWKCLTSLFGDC